jgi:hypothetical protein
MPETRTAAGERERLERGITRQVWLVTTLRFAGQDASEEWRQLGELQARLALLATAQAQRPPARPPGGRAGPRVPGRARPPTRPRVAPRHRHPGSGHGRVQ